MTKNIGDGDRTLRLLVGAISAFLFLGQRVTGTAGVVLGVIAAFFLATSLIPWCPFYALLRFSTAKPDDAAPPAPQSLRSTRPE
jgi:hypothetical protein